MLKEVKNTENPNNLTSKQKLSFIVLINPLIPACGYKVDVSLLAIYIKAKFPIKYYKCNFRICENNYYRIVEDMKIIICNEIPDIYRKPNDIIACEKLLRMDGDLIIDEADLADEKYINFKNGILNVESMEFVSHKDNSTDLIFINQVDYNYNPETKRCKFADDFFESVTNGNKEDIDYLYQVLGVLISGYRSFKNILYFVGPKDTGKSVYMHIAERLLSNSDGTMDCSSLGLKFFADETSMELTSIIGKRANICAENPEFNLKNVTLLKQLSGGDRITIRVKYKDVVNFINSALLIFSGNTVPKFIVNDSTSISDRFLVYKFKSVIEKSKQIKNLADKMNMEYIIIKAINQLIVFLKNNQEFSVSEEVYNNREEQLKESDLIYRFYKEEILITDSVKDRISNKDLFKEYVNYLIVQGFLPLNYNNAPDLTKIKTTQHEFISEIKKLHGDNNFKRNISYDSVKADVFVKMAIKNDSKKTNATNKVINF